MPPSVTPTSMTPQQANAGQRRLHRGCQYKGCAVVGATHFTALRSAPTSLLDDSPGDTHWPRQKPSAWARAHWKSPSGRCLGAHVSHPRAGRCHAAPRRALAFRIKRRAEPPGRRRRAARARARSVRQAYIASTYGYLYSCANCPRGQFGGPRMAPRVACGRCGRRRPVRCSLGRVPS